MTEKVFDLRKAARDEVKKATQEYIGELAEIEIGRTCYICHRSFPIDHIGQNDPFCPDCLGKIRKVIGVTV